MVDPGGNRRKAMHRDTSHGARSTVRELNESTTDAELRVSSGVMRGRAAIRYLHLQAVSGHMPCSQGREGGGI